jgi:hypothetical protein
MTAQMMPNTVVSEDLLIALQSLSPSQYQQVIGFARFLAQQASVGNGTIASSSSENWVDRVSGSFKDDPGFEEVLRYGREYRESGGLEHDAGSEVA